MSKPRPRRCKLSSFVDHVVAQQRDLEKRHRLLLSAQAAAVVSTGHSSVAPTYSAPIATISRAPNDPNAGPNAGQPLAFTRADFTFYDEHEILRPHSDCLRYPTLATSTHARFRFDKGPNNFTFRKFKRVPTALLCPVKAALSVLKRADILSAPSNYPIGAFRPQSALPAQLQFINGSHAQRVMQKACMLACPNPQHYLRLRIDLIMSHSNRVTAAVAMANAGISEEVIAFRLRWSVESVKFYTRDCFKAVGRLTEQAIQGAYLT